MRRIELKRPIQDPISKANLMPGFHNFSEELFAHRFIKALVKNGSIIPQEATSKTSVLAKSSVTILRQNQNKDVVKDVKIEEILPKPKEVNSEVEKAKEEEKDVIAEEINVSSAENVGPVVANSETTNARKRRK